MFSLFFIKYMLNCMKGEGEKRKKYNIRNCCQFDIFNIIFEIVMEFSLYNCRC